MGPFQIDKPLSAEELAHLTEGPDAVSDAEKATLMMSIAGFGGAASGLAKGSGTLLGRAGSRLGLSDPELTGVPTATSTADAVRAPFVEAMHPDEPSALNVGSDFWRSTMGYGDEAPIVRETGLDWNDRDARATVRDAGNTNTPLQIEPPGFDAWADQNWGQLARNQADPYKAAERRQNLKSSFQVVQGGKSDAPLFANGDDASAPFIATAARDTPSHSYEIVDRHTGKVVGSAKSLNAARRSVDRRDNQYGAVRYYHRKVQQEEPNDAR